MGVSDIGKKYSVVFSMDFLLKLIVGCDLTFHFMLQKSKGVIN